MRALGVPASTVLGAGLVLGIAGDMLLRAQGEPGLNLFLFIACVAVAAVLLHRVGDGGLSTEARIAAVARGAAIALPFIILFGGLFISADAVFASLVTDIVRIDLDTLASHVVLTGAILLWFTATVLRGRREPFAFGALIIGAATAVVLYAVNPDAVIARVNIDRAGATASWDGLDAAYATTLSADAVPVLLDALPSMQGPARGLIAHRLLERWTPDAPVPLRTWNWSEARARREVREHAEWLRSIETPAARATPPPMPPDTAPGVRTHSSARGQ